MYAFCEQEVVTIILFPILNDGRNGNRSLLLYELDVVGFEIRWRTRSFLEDVL